MNSPVALPAFLAEVLGRFADLDRADAVRQALRPPEACLTPPVMSAVKSSRVSFTRVLARHMIRDRWSIRLVSAECDGEGDGRFRYAMRIGAHRLTYVARAFRWDGVEKGGRRSDGAVRDLLGAIFLGEPSDERVEREYRTLESRDIDAMRTDSDVAGWTPASRSARSFDHAVDALVAGHQPDLAVLARGAGYLLRNGGFLGSGRHGTLSYEGYPPDHPLKHPYFTDLFGLYLVRQVSFDLVNAIARARNPNAAQLADAVARPIGVGNSSGQGMCVALQRWPHWVSTWMIVKEVTQAYARTARVAEDPRRVERVHTLLARAARFGRSVSLHCEDYVVPQATIASNLDRFGRALVEATAARRPDLTWGALLDAACAGFDPESLEQIHAILIETFPDFADAAAGYLPIGAQRHRDLVPEMRVGALRTLLRDNYRWALTLDRTKSRASQHFWYHSIDNGEQRRGERVIDPHEEYESFVDHVGLIQRLSSVLAAYDDDLPVAEVVTDFPEIAFAAARIQYMAGLPYSEIRGNIIDRDFLPAHLIRFYLAVLGMDLSAPLSIRYVRGVFMPGMPLAHEIAAGASEDWVFPALDAGLLTRAA